MNCKRNRAIRFAIPLFVGAIIGFPGWDRLGATVKPAAPKLPESRALNSSQETPVLTAKRRSSKRRRRSRRRYRGQRRPESKRIREIQQALINVGYLRGSPTGKWSTATREAMKRYQTDHGFKVTGRPEAKSLMKLGLGPHPLPPETDPSLNPSPTTQDSPAAR
jgi:peptidoglycan hydrolase-like protein with peptidoglycan-binding domain